ncbi:acyltransferase [Emticicia sp. BO119]|uniref:acyltransferase family protein n=1 Tax=Emticicia sp. BO119 TaxID=2757768 RepID=UPI0015F01B8F|nr:acyltransferase [Emticicia sp. BO119]MBA4850069.1 acyltransferase [Emticicia sp. BO119]
MNINRTNNFDLIRLIAAFQVLIWHGAVHFRIFDDMYGFLTVLFHFPGVPVFFTISGFLISHSLERNKFDLKKYFRNRALRIYPALWICTILTALLLIFFVKPIIFKDLLIWFVAQITFLQFYVTPSLKAWGAGHPNGSLWSVAVELQFYLILPILLYFINLPKKLAHNNIIIALLFLLAVFIKFFINTNTWILSHDLLSKFLGNTVFYYLYFFLTGIAIYKNFNWLEKYLKEKVFIWLVIYAAYVLIFHSWLEFYIDPYDISIFGIIANTLLSLLSLSFAFSYINLSKNLLHENDISYGIYIYHLPVINTMLSYSLFGSIVDLFVMAIIVSLIAYASWKLIEQRALKAKF